LRRDKDGRSVIVALSKKGRELFAGMAEAHEGWLNDLLASLSAAELRNLIEILSKLRKGR
jgi:DNA-binding MarR family transcriptional regulator